MAQDYDPTQPETFESPHRVFHDLRARCPLARSDAFDGFWMLTRYADIVEVLRDPDNFITSVRNVVPGSSTTGRRPPLHLDPPDHTPYRKALERALGRGRVAALEPAIKRHAENLIGAFVEKGEGDFVQEVSSPLPALVFAEWMGLTEPQTGRLWLAARDYVKAFEAFDKDLVVSTGEKLAELAREVLADRRANPRDPKVDPTSSLLASTDADGTPFPEHLLAGCVRQVLVVGLVAPPILFASVVAHFARHPETLALLRADPTLVPAAMEEFFRLYTPYRGFARTSRTEIQMHGRMIRPGEPIALAYAAANRDDTVFPDPDEFRLDRPNISDHLAFGMGPHRCVGMPVARLELTHALRVFVDKVQSVEIIGEIGMSNMPEVGPVAMPVRVRAG